MFVATAEARDPEMKHRIDLHRKERGTEWQTIEECIDLEPVLRNHPDGVLILDCLTLWLSNAMERGWEENQIRDQAELWIRAALGRNSTTIIVTNEVGMGIVPEKGLSRRYRDLLGLLNQKVATAADRVILMVSGIPMNLK
jgi:adenosyl cobinamide kinase/adenosyl cobinamide phosphate guanylyltransferase